MENQVRETSAAPVYTTIPLAFLAPPASEEEFDLASYWQILVRGKWLIFVVTVLVTAWSVYQAKIATPIYRAEVLLAPVGDKGGSGQVGGLAGLASIAGLSVGGGGASGTNLVIFKSRFFLENFIVNEKIVDIISKSDSELKKLDAGT
ncbi:MAG TPA: hypothetical protein HPQ00_17265, partial [Magnetococcales bacterium]|nr:hypothetical protein [Magnetococcales bacterium]